MGANEKNLSKEFEEAFKNACYRCGHTSHKAQDCKCRIYPNSTIMSLCRTCRNGLHDVCKSYKFKNKGPQDSAVATVKKLENMIGKFEQFSAHTIQSGPNHDPSLWYPPYPYPPPPALPQPQQRVGFTDEDDEDEWDRSGPLSSQTFLCNTVTINSPSIDKGRDTMLGSKESYKIILQFTLYK